MINKEKKHNLETHQIHRKKVKKKVGEEIGVGMERISPRGDWGNRTKCTKIETGRK